MQNEFLVLLL